MPFSCSAWHGLDPPGQRPPKGSWPPPCLAPVPLPFLGTFWQMDRKGLLSNPSWEGGFPGGRDLRVAACLRPWGSFTSRCEASFQAQGWAVGSSVRKGCGAEVWWMAIRPPEASLYSVGSVWALSLERAGGREEVSGWRQGCRNPCSSVPFSRVPACHRERGRKGVVVPANKKLSKDWS